LRSDARAAQREIINTEHTVDRPTESPTAAQTGIAP